MITDVEIKPQHCDAFNKEVQIRYITHSLFGCSTLPKKHIIRNTCLDCKRVPTCVTCKKNN